MKHYIFVLNLFLLPTLQLFAYSSHSKDSLLNIVEGKYHDTLKIDAYYNLASHTIDDDFELGYFYATMAIKLANQKHHDLKKAKSYHFLSRYFYKNSNYEKAKEHYKLTIQAYKNCKNNYGLAESCNELSNIYMSENNSSSCTLYMLNAIEAYGKENDSVAIAKCYIDLGGRLSHIGDYVNGINYLFKGLNSEAIKEDSLKIATGYSNLSNIYFYINKPQESLEYIKKSCEISKNIITDKYPKFLVNLGASYHHLADTFPSYRDSCIFYYEEALKYDTLLTKETLFALCNNLTLIHLECKNKTKAKEHIDNYGRLLSETDNTYHKNMYKLLRASFYFNTGKYKETITALKGFDSEGYIYHEKYYHENLHGAYQQVQNYKKAYFHIREFMLIKDSIKCAENYEAVYSKEAEFNYKLKEQKLVAQQEKERIVLNSRIKIRRLIIASLLFIVSLLVVFSRIIYVNYRNKKNDNILLAEQKKQIEDKEKITASLLKELNHRVKNNLQMVSGLLTMQAYKLKEEGAKNALNNARMRIESLSLLHQHLYNTTDNIDPNISTYIEHLANYAIDSSDVDNVELQLNIDDIRVKTEVAIHIGLMVNELIINALKYGTDPIKNDNWINIKLQKLNDQIIINISDSGNKSEKNDLKISSSSFGLKLIDILLTEYDGKLNTDLVNNGKVEITLNYCFNHQELTTLSN